MNSSNSSDISLSLSDFTVIRTLAEETSDTKFLLVSRLGQFFALKILSKSSLKLRRSRQRQVLDEKKILFKCRNSGIIKLFHTFADSEKLYFAFEFCPFNLGQWIKQRDEADKKFEESKNSLVDPKLKFQWSEKEIAHLISNILSALAHIHCEIGVAHRSLNFSSICFDQQKYFKLSEFGSLIEFEQNLNEKINSNFLELPAPNFAAPELISQSVCENWRFHCEIERKNEFGENLKFSCCRQLSASDFRFSDIWAVGTILFSLNTGKLPFDGENENSIKNNIKTRKIAGKERENFDISMMDESTALIHYTGLSAFSSSFSPECLDFLSLLWHPEPAKRPGGSLEAVKKARFHPLFLKYQINWDQIYNDRPPYASRFENSQSSANDFSAPLPQLPRPSSLSVSMPPLPPPPTSALRVHLNRPADRRQTMPTEEKSFRSNSPAVPLPVSKNLSAPSSPGEPSGDFSQWTRFLHDSTESVIMTGLVDKRSAMILKSRVQLILTSMPRLLWVDPNSMSVKGQRLIAIRDKVAASMNDSRGDEFFVHFNGEKPLTFISLSVRAVDWVRKINELVTGEQQKFQLPN